MAETMPTLPPATSPVVVSPSASAAIEHLLGNAAPAGDLVALNARRARRIHRGIVAGGILAVALIGLTATLLLVRPELPHPANPLVAAMAITVATAVLLAVPILALTTARARRRSVALTPDVAAWAIASELGALPNGADVPRPRRPAVLDRAELVAVTETALANRDLVGGDVALLVLEVLDSAAIESQLGVEAAAEIAHHTLRRLRAWLPPQDGVAQLGETTFAVLLEGLGEEGAGPQVTRITALLNEPMRCADSFVTVSFAAGLAPADERCGAFELLHLATLAATDAVRDGTPATSGETFEPVAPQADWFAESLHSSGRDHLTRTALRDRRLHASFRRVIALDGSGRTLALRTRARWSTDRPIEESAEAIDLHLIERGLDALSAWTAAGFDTGRLSLPLSAASLARPDLPALVAAALDRHRLPGTALTAEIEVITACDPEAILGTLTALRELGVDLLLTGVANLPAGLAMLDSLAATGVSLHRSLVEQLFAGTGAPDAPDAPDGADSANSAAADVIAVLHDRDVLVIGEDVQDPSWLPGLFGAGVDAAWGPAIGSPCRARDISAQFGRDEPPVTRR